MEKENITSHAIAKHVRISAQKCRLVTDLVRDRYVGEALTILHFSRKKKASMTIERANG